MQVSQPCALWLPVPLPGETQYCAGLHAACEQPNKYCYNGNTSIVLNDIELLSHHHNSMAQVPTDKLRQTVLAFLVLFYTANLRVYLYMYYSEHLWMCMAESYLFCFSLSSSLCRSLVRLSAWLFSSSRAALQASHCLSFSSNSSFRDSSSTTCSSNMLHVVFSVSMFWYDKHNTRLKGHL